MPTSTSFRIRVVGGISLLFVDGLSFDIVDTTNQLLCVYDYRGLSASLSTPISANFRGPWNNFRTRVPMDVGGFGGMAHIASIGGGDRSGTLLTISPLGGFPIDIEPMDTGFTAGFGAGIGMGAFSRMFPPIPVSQAPWPHNA